MNVLNNTFIFWNFPDKSFSFLHWTPPLLLKVFALKVSWREILGSNQGHARRATFRSILWFFQKSHKYGLEDPLEKIPKGNFPIGLSFSHRNSVLFLGVFHSIRGKYRSFLNNHTTEIAKFLFLVPQNN